MDYVKKRNLYNKDFHFYSKISVPLTEILQEFVNEFRQMEEEIKQQWETIMNNKIIPYYSNNVEDFSFEILCSDKFSLHLQT